MIVWVHGPQAVLLQTPHALRQRWDRRANGPLLYEIQVAPGPDRVLEALHGLAEIRSAGRLMNPAVDLDQLLAELTGAKRPWTVTRKRLPRDEFEPKGWTREDDGHVARLWAHGEVLRKSALGKASETTEAVETACAYRLVTPVSAAVVLESRAQYLAAGIEPPGPDAEGGPNVPEPGTWLMMILSTGAVAWAYWRRRRRRPAYVSAKADSTS